MGKPYQLWENVPYQGFSYPKGFDTFDDAKAAAEADIDLTWYIITGPVLFDNHEEAER